MDTRLRNYYTDIVVLQLSRKLMFEGYTATVIPKIVKVCINVGTKNTTKDVKVMQYIYKNLIYITGQESFFTKSKRSVSNFKLRKNSYIGLKITLRGIIMYEFLDRLINIVLPKIRDFKGFSEHQFDSSGNFSFGISDHTVFPESIYSGIQSFGMDINVVTSYSSGLHSKYLLKLLNFPFLD